MLHKHEPVPEKAMDWISPENTICNTIRQAYHLIDNDEARLKLREATAMAKAMTAKLQQYNRNWRKGFWSENEDFPFERHKKPIDVLFLCWDDNANTMFRFWQCAKYLGLNAVMFKGKEHAFGYPQQAPIHPSLSNAPVCGHPITVMAPGIESLIMSAHVIHLGASTYPMAAVPWNKLNVVVQHGGSVYRQHPIECNALFNQFAKSTIIQCPDLLGLGAVNERWVYYPVDTSKLKAGFEPKGNIPVVGHFPSNSKVKGSDTIKSVLENCLSDGLDFEMWVDDNRVFWPENLGRMDGCDIVIEGCNAYQGDKVYGEWGNQALEAAALGCAVITHCLSIDKYKAEFGEFGPEVANSPEELKAKLTRLVTDRAYLDTVKRRCRRWAENNHSIPVTANRLWDLVYKEFFG